MFVPRVEEYRLPPDEGVVVVPSNEESKNGANNKPFQRSTTKREATGAGGGFNQFSKWGSQQASRVAQDPDLEEDLHEVVEIKRREEYNSQRLRVIDEILPPPSRFKDMIGYAMQVSDRKDKINLCLKRTLLLFIFAVIHMSCTLLVAQQILLNLYHIGLSDYFSLTNELQLQSLAALDNGVMTITSPQSTPLVMQGSDSTSVRLRISSSSSNPSATQSLSFGSSSDVTRGYVESTYNGDMTINSNNNIYIQTTSSSGVGGGKVYINESTKITGDATVTGTIRAKYIDVTNTTWVFDEITAPKSHITNVTVGNLFLTNLYFKSLYLDVTTSTSIVGLNCTPSGGITVSSGATIFSGGLTVTDGLTVYSSGLQVWAGGQTVYNGGLVVANSGLTISNGGLLINAGGLTLAAGGIMVSGGVTIINNGLALSGGVTVSTGGLAATGGVTINNVGLHVLTGGVTINNDGIKVTGGGTFLDGGIVARGGLTVASGGLLVSASGLSISGGGVRVTGGMTLSSGSFSIVSGGMDVTGGATIESGDLFVNEGFSVGGATNLYDDVILQGKLIVAQAGADVALFVDGGGLIVSSGGLTVSADGLFVQSGGMSVAQGGVFVTGGVSIDGSAVISGGVTVSSGGLGVTGGATINDNGVVVTDGGLKVTAGGATILAGGLRIAASGVSVTGGCTIGDLGLRVAGGATIVGGIVSSDTGLKVTGGGATIAGGATVTTGGLGITAGGLRINTGGGTVTAGGIVITAGGLKVNAGGATVSGASVFNDALVASGGLTVYGSAVYSSSGTAQANWDTSDRRLKTDLQGIEMPIDKISKIRGMYFTWVSDDEMRAAGVPDASKYTGLGRQVGVFAQDVLSVLPEAVTSVGGNFLAVKYSYLIPLLFEGFNELYGLLGLGLSTDTDAGADAGRGRGSSAKKGLTQTVEELKMELAQTKADLEAVKLALEALTADVQRRLLTV